MPTLVQPVTILLVEDNLQDIDITRRALTKNHVKNDLVVVRDGEEALDYLYRRGQFKEPVAAPRPGMILLDLNLPKVDGLEVLRQIKSDPALRAIPVVALTASHREKDIEKTYALGVSTYIQKPVGFEQFVQVVQAIHEYWIVIGTLSPDNELTRT